MARTRKKPAPRRSGGGASEGTSSRAPRASVAVVEEEAGFGLEEGIVFFTTILVIAAFLFLDHARAGYGEGLFFN